MRENPGLDRASTDSADEHSMAQIREILFGEHWRQTAEHFARLESRLSEQDTALRTLLDQRLGPIQQSLADLRDGLASQGDQQQAALNDLDRALQALHAELGRQLSLVDSDLQDTAQRLQGALDAHGGALDTLQRQSVGRAQLADLFETLAQQLRAT